MRSDLPTLYHDPTSEPSRAVRWLSLEAGMALRVEPVLLTRGDHRRPAFLAINPRHQVPALSHGDFHLSEATAIARYLAEWHGAAERWFGGSLRERARINQRLSWYHTNLRLKLTLNYFLPALLMPAYLGVPPPAPAEAAALRAAFAETLAQLDAFLAEAPFVAGERPTMPDLLFASELFALDVDAARDDALGAHARIGAWLQTMRAQPQYAAAHRHWNAVVPGVRARLAGRMPVSGDPAWVAAVCARIGLDEGDL
ncbi:glutathione S-transferase family protein [Solimonas flava]|uniref:glutathione S-transferase family protein n=1 Tax=Solimonas flava TaxID=415849 RepID=UPI0003F76A40|nr:glutathione S-transferase family protein [Solimonas flava]